MKSFTFPMFFQITRMTINRNSKRNRELSISSHADALNDISEDNESNSDTEFDDISTDELVLQHQDSSDSDCSDDYLFDSYVNNDNDKPKHAQSEFIEKKGISWSSEKAQVSGRLPAINILTAKRGSCSSIQSILNAFRLFVTEGILNEIVVQTNAYTKRFF